MRYFIFTLVGLIGFLFHWLLSIGGLVIAILLFYYFKRGNKDVAVTIKNNSL